jgi:hypothetical protein
MVGFSVYVRCVKNRVLAIHVFPLSTVHRKLHELSEDEKINLITERLPDHIRMESQILRLRGLGLGQCSERWFLFLRLLREGFPCRRYLRLASHPHDRFRLFGISRHSGNVWPLRHGAIFAQLVSPFRTGAEAFTGRIAISGLANILAV